MKPFPGIDTLSGDAISLRRALFLATGAGLTACGLALMTAIVRPGGIAPLEWALLALFVPLFGQIAFGFTIAFWGFLVLVAGGDRYQIMRTLPAGDGPAGATAVVLPVFNEDPDRTFRGLENMFRSVEATGFGGSFDFFVLSDSNDPDRWVEEEIAWFRLCTKCGAFGRIFYRKRRVSLHGKSGNVADFCRRWGKRYQYLLVLDADSVMSGETILRLARAMDANPRAGIVQTSPQIVRGSSLLQRFYQFATRLAGPLFAAGSNFWHLGGGSYWGHNAIIRLKPFIEHCVLPEIPGQTAAERHILSHDTVEAALMRQAGYEVWFAYAEDGSYEEGPPNLTESLKRDRRWCQGNLQHFWFLFAPGTPFTNRIHIFFGLMAYLSAPLLVAFIALSSWDSAGKQRFARYAADPAVPADAGWATAALLGLTLALLFLPKLLGLLKMLPNSRECGGALRVGISAFVEASLSVLLAPILLYFYTKFVLLTALGMRVTWKAQNRDEAAISLRDAVGTFGGATLCGILVAAAALAWSPGLLLWLSPFLVGLLLAIPTAMLTSSEAAGGWLRRRGLLLVPEEVSAPPILRGLDRSADEGEPALPGAMLVAISPEVNALHAALLRRSRARARHKEEYLARLRARLLLDGPGSLARRELAALLWDSRAIEGLHREIWLSPDSALHASWRHALRHFNESAERLDRQALENKAV